MQPTNYLPQRPKQLLFVEKDSTQKSHNMKLYFNHLKTVLGNNTLDYVQYIFTDVTHMPA